MLGETLREDLSVIPRLSTPVFFRESTRRAASPMEKMGTCKQVCMFSDEAIEVGQHLDVDLFLENGETLRTRMMVRWIQTLGPNAPARFDVGLAVLALRGDTTHGCQALASASL